MDPELLTALVRAGNDGVIPAPLAGEDMRAYKFRAACAGAIVAVQWQEKTMADLADRKAQAQAQEQAPGAGNDAGFDGRGLSGAGMGGDRPDDDPGTSQGRPGAGGENDRIARRRHLNGSGAPHYGEDVHDQIGVD